MSDTHFDLRSFLQALRREKELVEVRAPVDPHLEIAEIHRRVVVAGGPALLFLRPRGRRASVVTNLFGTSKRVELAFGPRPRQLVERIAELPVRFNPPSPGALWRERGLLRAMSHLGVTGRSRAPVLDMREEPPDLRSLPVLTSWKKDDGPSLAMPLVYTEHPEGRGHNLDVYQMQIHDAVRAGIRWPAGEHAGFHHAAAESRGSPLPVNVFLGGPPALLLAAMAPLPESMPKLLLASLVMGDRLAMVDNPAGPLPLAAGAEFALVGEVLPGERAPTGPIGDRTGAYSPRRDSPVFHCRTLFHRRDAIFPAVVPGKPRGEDSFLTDYLQELFAPLLRVAMPAVRDLRLYPEAGFHSLAAAVVRRRHPHEAVTAGLRILGESQFSSVRLLLVVDRAMDLRDASAVLEYVLERADFRADLRVFSDPTSDEGTSAGSEGGSSKAVLFGIGSPVRDLPREFTGHLPSGVKQAEVFCAGCLVVSGPGYREEPEAASRLAHDPAFHGWPLVVLTDDARRACASPASFLWTVFSRFDPVADLHAAGSEVVKHRVSYAEPVVLEARRKPSDPEELIPDERTEVGVSRRWKEYFPRGLGSGSAG